MAHTCPECGMTCHCNGDIDDLCLDFDEDVLACTHCDGFEYAAYEEYEDESYCDGVEGGCGCCPYDEPICAQYFEEQELPY
jgi:hypothetical protein